MTQVNAATDRCQYAFGMRASAAFDAVEIGFDRAFPAALNPWRNLGGLAFLLFWTVAATGIYVYIGFDTRADGAYASVERLSGNAFPLGSLARSLHRYASDAFVLVVVLHLVREWVRGRYAHFRRFSWTSGVVALWLVFASGIGGFWLVWDGVAHYSLVATMEWLDALPFFDGALVRNFMADEAVSDRLFSLLIFLHIGFPLALLACMGVHLQRLSRPATSAPRALTVGTLVSLVALSLAYPVSSATPADPSLAPEMLALDWFYLWIHAFADATSPQMLWLVVAGGTPLLFVLPWFSRSARAPRPPAARVDLRNCNGCARCADDCPYAAVTMQPRTDGRTMPVQAVVDPDLCAACGICVGACPSSTPFRSSGAYVPGIDMPELPIERVRAAADAALARLRRAPAGPAKVLVFGCATGNGGADLSGLDDATTATVELLCAGQLPPAFVEYALRTGADGVLVAGCREGDCEYRLGNRWTAMRLRSQREPQLRSESARQRLETAWVGRGGKLALARELAKFRDDLSTAIPIAPRARPKRLECSP
jgi:quinol-cytochrome oxidoreductase complex cytochrome b subunit/coenzyme F420-reducing hydrogenase delta subunit/NAD-dependent dihydropyrimidine dehydrogenase PreA subunit